VEPSLGTLLRHCADDAGGYDPPSVRASVLALAPTRSAGYTVRRGTCRRCVWPLRDDNNCTGIAMTENDIGGTVIQRSFVPKGLGIVINIATVPLDEIIRAPEVVKREDFLRNITAEILGAPPSSLIDDSQYQRLGSIFSSEKFLARLMESSRHPFEYEWMHYNYRYLQDDLRKRMAVTDQPRRLFARDILALLARPDPLSVALSPFAAGGWPYYLSRRGSVANSDEFRELQLTTEALQAGLSCIYSGVDAEDRVRSFTTTLEGYQIPMGQSPDVKGESLLKMIDTGQKVCLTPLVAAGAVGIGQLQQAAYVAALLTVGTGAAMTLMLIGTLSVGDFLVRYLMHKRPPIGEQSSATTDAASLDEKQKRKK